MREETVIPDSFAYGGESFGRLPDGKAVFVPFALPSEKVRIRLIEELRTGEKDVNSLAETLALPGARVSQHLSLLRAHRLVEERRDGRHHFYHLIQPEIAGWIVDGLDFVGGRMAGVWFTGLTETQTQLFESQAGGA